MLSMRFHTNINPMHFISSICVTFSMVPPLGVMQPKKKKKGNKKETRGEVYLLWVRLSPLSQSNVTKVMESHMQTPALSNLLAGRWRPVTLPESHRQGRENKRRPPQEASAIRGVTQGHGDQGKVQGAEGIQRGGVGGQAA